MIRDMNQVSFELERLGYRATRDEFPEMTWREYLDERRRFRTQDESPHLDATPRFPAEAVGSLLEEE